MRRTRRQRIRRIRKPPRPSRLLPPLAPKGVRIGSNLNPLCDVIYVICNEDNTYNLAAHAIAHELTYHHLDPSPASGLESHDAPSKSSASARMLCGIVPVSPTGTTGSLDRIDVIGTTTHPNSISFKHKYFMQFMQFIQNMQFMFFWGFLHFYRPCLPNKHF
jgi:hypothetical protein